MNKAGHAVLVGDSVFDNRAYIRGPDVVALLRQRLPDNWTATLLAVDGAIIADVPAQLGRLPADATHVVVSAGGNDALRVASVLEEAATTVSEAVIRLAAARDGFWRDYRVMLDAVAATRLPAGVATIYEPRFPDPGLRKVASAALAMLNDCITREAFSRGCQ
jgi:hypothetical protein